MSVFKLLIGDDDPQTRRVLRIAMVAQGLTVNDAAHGEEALERLRDDLSDVILRDLKVPRMGGTEACREIWGASEVPIIVVSVSSSRDVLTTQRAAYGPL